MDRSRLMGPPACPYTLTSLAQVPLHLSRPLEAAHGSPLKPNNTCQLLEDQLRASLPNSAMLPGARVLARLAHPTSKVASSHLVLLFPLETDPTWVPNSKKHAAWTTSEQSFGSLHLVLDRLCHGNGKCGADLKFGITHWRCLNESLNTPGPMWAS